jgi:hypothetical protein
VWNDKTEFKRAESSLQFELMILTFIGAGKVKAARRSETDHP